MKIIADDAFRHSSTTYNAYWRGAILDTSFNDAVSSVKTYISPLFYKKGLTAILSHNEICSAGHSTNGPPWYKGADKSLAWPGRKQATATEDLDFHISYL